MCPIIVDGIEYYSATEVIKHLSITRQTLWRWRQNSNIPAGRLFRNHQLVFTSSELEEIEIFANRLVPCSAQTEGQLTLFSKA